MLNIFFDIVLMGLCIIVLIYLFKMRNAVLTLHESRGELKNVIKDFSENIVRAEAAVTSLKNSGSKNLTAIQNASKKAINLYDDLEFLIHRGSDIADRLEAISYQSREKIEQNDLKAKKRKKLTKDQISEEDNLLESLGNLR